MPLPSTQHTFDFSLQEGPPPAGRGNRPSKPTAKFTQYQNSLSKSRRNKNNGPNDLVLEAADVVADTISQGTYITDIGSTPWPTPTATSSPPLNFGVGFQPRAPRPILFQPYPRLSPGSTVIDRHSIEGFNTFGEVAYNPILNPDEQSQEELWDSTLEYGAAGADHEAADEHLIELPPMPKSMIKSSRVTLDRRRSARCQTANANTRREIKSSTFPSNLPASEQLIKMSDSEDEAENESKKHPRLRDLNNSHRMSLTTVASSYFSCTVLTGNPFPEGITVSDMVLRAWKVASDELGVEFLPPSVDERALIIRYIAQARGKVKTLAREKLIQHDPFKRLNTINMVTDCGTGEERDETEEERVARVRDVVTSLTNDLAFLFENPLGSPHVNPATGEYGLGSMFGHPLIQDISNELFFRRGKSTPMGIKHAGFFVDGMPHQAIALISTAILCAIHEYATGTFAGVDFTDSDYSDEYQFVLAKLQEWENTCKRRETNGLQEFQMKLTRSGRAHFGISEGNKIQKVSQTSKRSFGNIFDHMESSKRQRLGGNSQGMS